MLRGDSASTEAGPGTPGTTRTLMFSLVMRGQATFSFHFLIKHVIERSERFSRESCQDTGDASLLSVIHCSHAQD